MLLYSMGDCADDILATLSKDETLATYQEMPFMSTTECVRT